MIKNLVKRSALVAMVWAAFSLTVRAEDTLILDKDRDSVVSGTVISGTSDSLLILNNNNEIKVDLSNLDLDSGARELLKPGTQVIVEGRFKDQGATPEFEADRLLRNGDESISSSDAILLNHGLTD